MRKLNTIIKGLKGTLLGIGLDEKLLEIIEKNNDINNCFIMEDRSRLSKKFDFFGGGKDKKINIKKIRKIFKKKTLDNIICNYETIKPYFRRFVSNSIYINKGKLYIYGNLTNDDIEKIQTRYSRYKSKITIQKEKDYAIIIIDNADIKTGFFKDKLYIFLDFFTDFIDILTTLLVG